MRLQTVAVLHICLCWWATNNVYLELLSGSSLKPSDFMAYTFVLFFRFHCTFECKPSSYPVNDWYNWIFDNLRIFTFKTKKYGSSDHLNFYISIFQYIMQSNFTRSIIETFGSTFWIVQYFLSFFIWFWIRFLSVGKFQTKTDNPLKLWLFL